ncbi:major facilitator superfamily domain-containing protein [Chaetomium sp. MPI-CAGE-AT-0009]|nr:major facilitator superfamily domain-containing protein [Chaetomium sp. MPI-CAGE-AT-0009]
MQNDSISPAGPPQTQAEPGSPGTELNMMNPTDSGKTEESSRTQMAQGDASAEANSRQTGPENTGPGNTASDSTNQQTDNPPGTTAVENTQSVNVIRVGWLGNDPQNPRNWPKWRKAIRIGQAALQGAMVQSGAFILVSSIPILRDDPQADYNLELAGFAVSVYLVGFAAGPLLWRPLSTVLGSALLDVVTGVCFGIVTLLNLIPVPLALFVVLRFLAGVFGGGALVNGPTIIGDLLRGAARDVFRTMYIFSQFAGFAFGPVVARLTGWGPNKDMMSFIGGGETYAPVLLEVRASGLRRRNSNPNNEYRSRYDTGLTTWQSFRQKAAEPLKLFFTNKECAGHALLAGLLYGFQYFMFTTMDLVLLKAYPNVFQVGPHLWAFGAGDLSAFLLFSRPDWGALPIILLLAPTGAASAFTIWSSHKAMDASFNHNESSNHEHAARAASVIVCAVVGGLCTPYGLVLEDKLEAGAGTTLLVMLWLGFIIVPYIVVRPTRLVGGGMEELGLAEF